MDLYAALELHHEATPEEIRLAYRRLAKRYHPDVSALPDAQQRFVRITEAYEVLSNPAKRLRYDLTRHSPSPRRATPQEAPSHERAVNRFQREARMRAERFSKMTYEDFDAQYFDSAFGYFAPKMLGCAGIVIAFFVALAIIGLTIESFDLPIGLLLLAMLLLVPAGVWASTEIDAWHNRRQRRRKTGV